MLNEKTVNVKMKRIELCDLLMAVTLVGQASDAKKWKALHDMLKAQLDAFDERHADEI